jgi:two-component system NtrC family sensor kinase
MAKRGQMASKRAITAVDTNENAKLRRELIEARRQQAATADVLQAISHSTFDLQAVLDIVIAAATRLCGADMGILRRRMGEVYELAATYGLKSEWRDLVALHPNMPGRHSVIGRAALSGRTVQVPDVLGDPEFVNSATQKLIGFRAVLASPMLRDSELIGTLGFYRLKPGPFSQTQVKLIEGFADQAVVAIENVRLFDEVQARTEDFRESLEYQTAISDVLNVISRSPSDIQPVLDTIAETAKRLCQSENAYIFRLDGDRYHLVAAKDVSGERIRFLRDNPIAPDRDSTVGRVALERRPVHILDAQADPEYKLSMVGDSGYRCILGVPLLRDGIAIGVIILTRSTVQPFLERQIELVSTFADQALIAIENVRLFDEVQARTEDLRESLQQQTATADVLKVISRSTFDLQTVLQTLVESATLLCDAELANIWRPKGASFHLAASFGVSGRHKERSENAEYLGSIGLEPGRGSIVGRVLLEKGTVQVDDIQADPEYQLSEVIRIGDYRTVLGVPLLREGAPIGVLFLSRCIVQPFTEKQIELVTTFADQAVIAIENARLFDEVQAKTRDLSEALVYQTGSGNILRVIASSPTDVGPVLKAIVESACELCDAVDAIVLLNDGDSLRTSAHYGPIPLDMERWPISQKWVAGRAFLDRKPVHVHDLLSAEGDEFPETQQRTARTGTRSILSVPLLREGKSIGTIVLRRTEVHPFSDKQIALLQTFADQAVIAIGNVRMFEQVQERTKELSLSLDELRTAQDRLIQTEKLASLGQLTAGIAHEIKNPLNFVNNFSALSVELVDELDDVLKPATLDNKTREETNDLTQMLRGNLEKIVQHGQRADSIVKNMLLHSREGSGESRSVDLNAIVEDSLNLAYHGARAEKKEFNIRLERSFDPAAGMVDLFPQEITRVLLNLISNGVYAAMKRKVEMRDGYEPTLTAVTGDLGDRVEIRIRDNGGGIPPGVKEKIFNPFFTTKPPGEGTGLGLSLSYDIIVKQHSGSIEVDTQPGEFTEFRIILPRKAALSKAGVNS